MVTWEFSDLYYNGGCSNGESGFLYCLVNHRLFSKGHILGILPFYNEMCFDFIEC
jgi:hypothetical protein